MVSMKSFSYLVLALAILTFTGLPAYAQEAGGALLAPEKSSQILSATPEIRLKDNKEVEPDIWEKISRLPPEIQEEILDETAEAELNCKRTPHYFDYYDCSCFAIQFLKDRYEKGPEELLYAYNFSNLDLSSCVFKPSIAGEGYKRCLKFVNKTLREEDQKKVCECAALETADAFAAKPRPNVRYVNNLLVSMLSSCQRKVVGGY